MIETIGAAEIAGGEVVDGGKLAGVAATVAARQRAATTRSTYASVYRAFSSALGPDAGPEHVTPAAVLAWRDRLEAAGAAPATVAKHLSALRALAAAVGADPAVREVRSQRIDRGEPRPLTANEYARLLRMPDRRTNQGKRDLALLLLLGSVGLRRAEAAALRVGDVDERRRAADGQLRRALSQSTAWWVTVVGKRGKRRRVPLERDVLDALAAWFNVRPACAHDELLVSLPRTGRPPAPLNVRDVGRIVARYGKQAGLPDDRRGPHALRHTFCTQLASAGAPIEVIRELAGHADIRTTTIYTSIDAGRLEHAVDAVAHQRRGLARAAVGKVSEC